jgi:hypothetical protein
LVPLQQLCPLEQQATAPPGAMQGAPPASLQVPQAVTQAVNAALTLDEALPWKPVAA